MSKTATAKDGTALPVSSRKRLATLVESHGAAFVVDAFGLSRSSLARAMAGLGVRRGTILQVEVGFARLDRNDLTVLRAASGE